MLGIELAARVGRHRVSLSLVTRTEPAENSTSTAEPRAAERVHAGEAATELAMPRPVGFGFPWDEPS